MLGAGAFMTYYGFKTRWKGSFLATLGRFLALAGALCQLKQKLIKNHLNPTKEDVVLGAGAFRPDYGFKTRCQVYFLANSGCFLGLAGALCIVHGQYAILN